jgi:hypothetical protein
MSAAVKLHAGKFELDGQLTPGSMSRAIEDELAKLIPVKPNEDPIPRQRFALAIALGVVGHLHANQAAFVVDVPNVAGATVERPGRVDVE